MSKSKYGAFIFLILFSGSVFSGIQLSDDGKTPLEQFMDKRYKSGVFSVYDALNCSQSASHKHLPELLSVDTVVKTLDNGKQVTVENNMNILLPIIEKALNLLTSNNDIYTTGKHICAGFFKDEASINGNAFSFTHGYMIFDFRLIQYLYDLPDDKRSSWVYDFLALHEFSHQLQYWNGDKNMLDALQQKQSSKKSELAADCAAAALLVMQNTRLPDDLYKVSVVGIMGAANALGDFDVKSQTHHGTPVEREKAAKYGEWLVSSQKDNINNGTLKLTSDSILKSCNSYIELTLN